RTQSPFRRPLKRALPYVRQIKINFTSKFAVCIVQGVTDAGSEYAGLPIRRLTSEISGIKDLLAMKYGVPDPSAVFSHTIRITQL
ncbi:MAG: hypothetical protein IKM00_05565, partial [Clostridia bacterium]|nr:hypothetical protein [Clostridia bacterium]